MCITSLEAGKPMLNLNKVAKVSFAGMPDFCVSGVLGKAPI